MAEFIPAAWIAALRVCWDADPRQMVFTLGQRNRTRDLIEGTAVPASTREREAVACYAAVAKTGKHCPAEPVKANAEP